MSWTGFTGSSTRWAPQATGVECTECAAGELTLRFSCLNTRFVCASCGAGFLLADLVHRVDETRFEMLASFVSDRTGTMCCVFRFSAPRVATVRSQEGGAVPW